MENAAMNVVLRCQRADGEFQNRPGGSLTQLWLRPLLRVAGGGCSKVVFIVPAGVRGNHPRCFRMARLIQFNAEEAQPLTDARAVVERQRGTAQPDAINLSSDQDRMSWRSTSMSTAGSCSARRSTANPPRPKTRPA